MNRKFRLLDLFCGAGGCSVGYHRAGFEVAGVDNRSMPRYPFEFHQADALEFVAAHGHEFDAIHASPPCQAYSEDMRHLSSGQAEKLIDPVRELLQQFGRPWVIENVEGSPLSTASGLFGEHGVLLCGTQFSLRIWRHRKFETSFACASPGPCRHNGKPINPHREDSRQRMRAEFGQVDLEAIWRREAGVEWMDRNTGRQAIPPAYTEFIGRQLLDLLIRRADDSTH